MTNIQLEECPFCMEVGSSLEGRVLAMNSDSYCILDAYPVSKGHALVIPSRHIQSLFDATKLEKSSLLELLDIARSKIDEKYAPDGYNIGVNEGAAAGQTVAHLHIHLIPRYNGDVEKPEGGIRWIFPEKAAYWE